MKVLDVLKLIQIKSETFEIFKEWSMNSYYVTIISNVHYI